MVMGVRVVVVVGVEREWGGSGGSGVVVVVGASFSNRAPSRCGDCGQAISWWSV